MAIASRNTEIKFVGFKSYVRNWISYSFIHSEEKLYATKKTKEFIIHSEHTSYYWGIYGGSIQNTGSIHL